MKANVYHIPLAAGTFRLTELASGADSAGTGRLLVPSGLVVGLSRLWLTLLAGKWIAGLPGEFSRALLMGRAG